MWDKKEHEFVWEKNYLGALRKDVTTKMATFRPPPPCHQEKHTKEGFCKRAVQWLPAFRQSKEKHNDNSKIALSLFRAIQDNK